MALANAAFNPSDPASPLSISPHETAILLMDYQNMILSRIGDAAASSVLNIASHVRDWALQKDMTVCHCLIDTSPSTKPPSYNRASAKWKAYESAFAANPGLGHEAEALAAKGHSGSEVTVVRVPGFVSALESHGLLDALMMKGIKSLILGGLSTSGCVLSTARAGTDRGFIVTVVRCPFLP